MCGRYYVDDETAKEIERIIRIADEKVKRMSVTDITLQAKDIHPTDKAEYVLLIPVMALNADKTGDFVYVEENGIVVRKDIVTGISTTEHIEVKEGLSADDKVIVSSFTSIEEGMAVLSMPKEVTE